jgi:hypothetical protein
MRGKVFSHKIKIMVPYGSWIMKRFVYLLDFDPTVSSYTPEPFPIYFIKSGGVETYTIPDFLATLKNGHRILVECKPESKLTDPDVIQKIQAGKRFSEQQKDMAYLLITDTQLKKIERLIFNIIFLRRYHKLVVPPQFHDSVLETLLSIEKIRLDTLALMVGNGSPQSCMYIYNMLYWGELVADIRHTEINLKSWVYLPPKEEYESRTIDLSGETVSEGGHRIHD